jgi:hypothetical protein
VMNWPSLTANCSATLTDRTLRAALYQKSRARLSRHLQAVFVLLPASTTHFPWNFLLNLKHGIETTLRVRQDSHVNQPLDRLPAREQVQRIQSFSGAREGLLSNLKAVLKQVIPWAAACNMPDGDVFIPGSLAPILRIKSIL